MIPTFNCARFLGETLRSVFAQDPGPAKMHICVVDDCSTKDDPEAVVRGLGGGRVAFVRNEANLGATRNFNRCIELSCGELVHILHGDDLVSAGFYDVIERMAHDNPDCAFYATRTMGIDENGVPEWISARTKTLERASNDVSEVVRRQPFWTPSVVVRRSFYERHGGFDMDLVHCADWEMWARAIYHGGGLVHTEPLARYRTFASNDSSRLEQTGENVDDHLRLIGAFAKFPAFQQRQFIRMCADLALGQAQRFASAGDTKSAAANFRVYRSVAPLHDRLRRSARASARRLARLVGVVHAADEDATSH